MATKPGREKRARIVVGAFTGAACPRSFVSAKHERNVGGSPTDGCPAAVMRAGEPERWPCHPEGRSAAKEARFCALTGPARRLRAYRSPGDRHRSTLSRQLHHFQVHRERRKPAAEARFLLQITVG